MTSLNTKEREDLSLLLPWYVAGTLEEADAARIDAALEHDAGLRAELAIVLEDQAATLEVIEQAEVPASMQARFNAALENAIVRDKSETATRDAQAPGLLQQIAGFFAPPRRLAFAAIAAALLIVAQGGAILALVSIQPDGQTGYVTASGDKAGPSEGLFVLARFAEQASATGISEWLLANGGHIVDGPLPGGMYRLRFPMNAAVDTAKLAETLAKQTKVFAMVLPAG